MKKLTIKNTKLTGMFRDIIQANEEYIKFFNSKIQWCCNLTKEINRNRFETGIKKIKYEFVPNPK